MEARKYLPVVLIILGLVLFTGGTTNSYSKVAFGVRYHSGPLTVAIGNYGYYPYSYHPVHRYYSWPRRHYRHYNYYRHDRGRHRGWYKRGHHRGRH
jgi:hypothetical protein